MFSQRQFTPGKKSNSSKLIYYTALLNAQNPNREILCNCIEDKYDKFVSQSNTPNTSYNSLLSQKIKSSVGGSTQFGNYYLGKPPVFNYLGRLEGQPGGSGSPPRNQF
jgi:hypothetical protein